MLYLLSQISADNSCNAKDLEKNARSWSEEAAEGDVDELYPPPLFYPPSKSQPRGYNTVPFVF
jgi:hypothetical protein